MRGLIAAVVLLGCVATVANAADFGILSKKLILVQKPTSEKLVFVGGRDAAIFVGGAPDTFSLTWSYEAEGGGSSVGGAFAIPPGSTQWVGDKFGVAKYRNTAPCTETCLRSVNIRYQKLVRAVSRVALSDEGDPDLALGAPTATAGVLVVVRVVEGGTPKRWCTRFASDQGSTVLYKPIAGGAGRKLIARDGARTSCPSP